MSNDGGNSALRALRAKWGSVDVPVIEHEDRLSEHQCREIWSDVYTLFGATGEAAHLEVKLAVWCYYAVNGTSQRTPHAATITTAGGVSTPAADVLRKIGVGRVRRFLRGDQDEAYVALTESGALEEDDVFVSRVANEKGIERGYVHCAVDYLRGCSLFTPKEAELSNMAFRVAITRADKARGGVTMEEAVEEVAMRNVKAGTTPATRGRERSTDSGF